MKNQGCNIFLVVTNNLAYDQRMSKICSTLHEAGYNIHLIGIKDNTPLPVRPYRQIRLTRWFAKGKLFYLENHIRLFFFLLFRKADLLVANDLDTALPVWLVSTLRGIPRLMDAHEYFTEMKEVKTRPLIHKTWSALASFLIPRFPSGYTVSGGLVERFEKHYGVRYELIRNLPVKRKIEEKSEKDEAPFLLYQGAVNHGRGFETLIPAMRDVPYKLVICGDGNFMEALKQMIKQEGVAHRVQLTGMLSPEDLRKWTNKATIGISLLGQDGLSQYWSLQNKFFDYMEAGLPQISRRFPEYERINQEFPVAVLLDEMNPTTVSSAINDLMRDEKKRNDLRDACLRAREVYCWENEKGHLLRIYKNILNK